MRAVLRYTSMAGEYPQRNRGTQTGAVLTADGFTAFPTAEAVWWH